MVHITLDGYTGAAERRPRRDARSLHTGTTLFRSVPLSLSRLSPCPLPTFTTALLRNPLYPALRRYRLSLHPSPMPVSFSLYAVPRTVSLSLSFLPSRFHDVAARISFFHLLHRHWTSSILLATLRPFSFLVVPISVPLCFSPCRRAFSLSTRAHRIVSSLSFYILYPTLCQSRFHQRSVSRFYFGDGTPRSSPLHAFPSSSFSASSVSFVAAFRLLVPFSSTLSPFSADSGTSHPLIFAVALAATLHPAFLFVALEIPPHPRHALVVDRRGGRLRTCKLE